jgi:rhodanese-related sulfurtransferase
MSSSSVEQLAVALQASELGLLDVREVWEFELCHIPGSVLVPLGELSSRLGDIPATRPLVVICHHGVRSEMAQHYLLQQGVTEVLNLVGGIAEWAAQIDPDMPHY